MEIAEDDIDIEKTIKIEEVLWIEDDVLFVNKNKPIIEGKYFEFFNEKIKIDVAHDVADGIKKFKKGKGKYKLAMIDIEMDPPEKNGFIAMRTISGLSPQTKFIIVSANLKQPKWIDLLESDRFKNIPNFEKPFSIAQSRQYKSMLEIIKNTLHSNKEIAVENFNTFETIEEVDETKTDGEINPFDFKFDEFSNFPEEKINEIFEVASNINKDFTEKYFKEHPEIDWIVIAVKPGNIIASGMKNNMIYEEDLIELAKKNNCPVFAYGRPVVIEEVDSSWKNISNTDDHYPTVVIEFNNTEGNKIKIKGDFDTGNPYSFISYEELVKHFIVRKSIMQFKRKDQIWGQEFSYYSHKIPGKLLGLSNCKEINLDCNSVINWTYNSPFCMHYKNRVALIGRNILLQNNLKIILDGHNRLTDIII